jgi:hypothetical protein
MCRWISHREKPRNVPSVPVLFLVTVSLFAAEPVRTAWIMSSNGNAAVARIAPDVHSVEVAGTEVLVRSAGISLAYLGPLQSAPQPPQSVQEFCFRIPTTPQPAAGRHAHVPAGFVGAFVNGVPIYNQFEAASYRRQNLWHYDLIARGNAAPGLIEDLIPDRGQHSPILGFALDGYPIYGPWADGGGALRRMRSSYRLRKLTTRDRWPDGTLLAPGQYGPPVSAEFPLGTFVEDYEYVPGSGDLDQYNGRFARTPQYPNATYAYFLTTDDRRRLTFPYLLAHEYYGRYGAAAEGSGDAGAVRFQVSKSMLQLDIQDARGRPIRYLEYVHEKPIHLLIVSHDLALFDHIHPDVTEQGSWQVSYKFAYGGRYRLYADFTPPGSNARLESYDVTVDGPALPPQPKPSSAVQLEETSGLRAGEDVELHFKLASAGLEPYLGAWAHVAIAGEGLHSFIHAHPLEEGASLIKESESHSHAPETLGPPPGRIRVVTSFPRAGRYKLWVQTQVAGKVETTPIVVQVAAATPKPPAEARIPADAIPIRITPGGFEPARVEIPAGKPVTLVFRRSSDPNCGSKVVFPDLGLTRDVPLGGSATVEIPATAAGEIRFACGMGMYRGSLWAMLVQ